MKPNQDTQLEFSMYMIDSGSKAMIDINANIEYGVSTGGGGTRWCLHYNTGEKQGGQCSLNTQYIIYQNKNYLYVDGVEICSLTYANFQCTKNLSMFSEILEDNTISAKSSMRLYYCKIWG